MSQQPHYDPTSAFAFAAARTQQQQQLQQQQQQQQQRGGVNGMNTPGGGSAPNNQALQAMIAQIQSQQIQQQDFTLPPQQLQQQQQQQLRLPSQQQQAIDPAVTYTTLAGLVRAGQISAEQFAQLTSGNNPQNQPNPQQQAQIQQQQQHQLQQQVQQQQLLQQQLIQQQQQQLQNRQVPTPTNNTINGLQQQQQQANPNSRPSSTQPQFPPQFFTNTPGGANISQQQQQGRIPLDVLSAHMTVLTQARGITAKITSLNNTLQSGFAPSDGAGGGGYLLNPEQKVEVQNQIDEYK